MPTLVVLAAGMGSRYGGLKQIDPVGPHGQIILDYSIYDAVRSGFRRVVFVIRRQIEDAFRELIERRYPNVECHYVYQEADSLPHGFLPPEGRKKPWGTGHAVLAAEKALDSPFCVINADDFYGHKAYEQMAGFLNANRRGPVGSVSEFAIVGFSLGKTLSSSGAVSRGICEVSADGNLISVKERTHIEHTADGIHYYDSEDKKHCSKHSLSGQEVVSMNFWGFTPDLFPSLNRLFRSFLEQHLAELSSEFFLPSAIDVLIREKLVSVKVLKSPDQWVGITHPKDKQEVSAYLSALEKAGIYPERLWPERP